MGQFAKDWDSLKAVIRDKDNALDAQAAQLNAAAQQAAALKQQLASLQLQFDADDQKAAVELHQVVTDNAPAATLKTTPAPAAGAAVTTFTK